MSGEKVEKEAGSLDWYSASNGFFVWELGDSMNTSLYFSLEWLFYLG